MDVFSTVVGVIVAAIALFVGYKIGVKDGFRGGVQTGRHMERAFAEQERRLLLARTVRAQAQLETRLSSRSLPAPEFSGENGSMPEQMEFTAFSDSIQQVRDRHPHP